MTSLARAVGLLALSGIASTQTAAQAATPTAVPLPPFRSVELRHGAHAILRHGPTQRVTFLKGSPDDARVTVARGGELVIEKGKSRSSRRYELEIEIVTPELAHITVAHGGWIQSRGTFPRQVEIGVTVDNGGTIDVRSMSLGRITASVLSGGIILVKPLGAMAASVVQGGNITYWGDAPVTQSIEHGGVIIRGAPSDADRPLSELNPGIAPVAPRPPQPPSKARQYLWL